MEDEANIEKIEVAIKKKKKKIAKPLVRDAYSPMCSSDDIRDPLNDPILDIPLPPKRTRRKEDDEPPVPISVFDVTINVYKSDEGRWKVGIFHKATGIEVFEDSEGSIYRNRIGAMKKLYEELKHKNYG